MCSTKHRTGLRSKLLGVNSPLLRVQMICYCWCSTVMVQSARQNRIMYTFTLSSSRIEIFSWTFHAGDTKGRKLVEKSKYILFRKISKMNRLTSTHHSRLFRTIDFQFSIEPPTKIALGHWHHPTHQLVARWSSFVCMLYAPQPTEKWKKV